MDKLVFISMFEVFVYLSKKKKILFMNLKCTNKMMYAKPKNIALLIV